jgi:hypothetical protein
MIEHNGKNYARVSDILSPFNDFSSIDPAVLANKARIGTEVHQAIADDINDEFPIPGPGCLGYFNSYLRWKGQLNPKFLQSEQRYFCDKKMISGQIDCLVDFGLISGLPTLIDFKTSAQESLETWTMQAHLYNHLLAENGIEVNPTFLFIKLNKEGKLPDVFSYHYSQNIRNKCYNAIDKFWGSR